MLVKKLSTEDSRLFNLINTGEARLHFSQLGEDAVLWHHFGTNMNGFYVDVGCHHPYRFSNTALLATFNDWQGINVDLDERAIAAFRAIRPNDTNLNIAIGLTDGESTVTVFEEGAVNSLDPAMANHQAQTRAVKAKKMIRTRPLASVLQEHMPSGIEIDFMNIDAEGWDQIVLESNDWERYRPKVIAVESHGFNLNNPQVNETFRFLVGKGYSLTSHVVVTSIYERVG